MTKLEQYEVFFEEVPLFSDKPKSNIRLVRKSAKEAK